VTANGCKCHANMATISPQIVDNPEFGLFTKAARLLRAAAPTPRGAAMNDISVTTPTAAAVVDGTLRLLMIPDTAGACRFVAPDLCIRLTEGRAMRDPGEHNAEWLLVHAGLATL
jgi:hypothetical protein